MFTCGNKALVVGDSTTIVEFSFPTNDVKFNDPVSTYDRNAAVFFVIQFDGIAVEFVLFEKETEEENKSLTHDPQSNNKY